MSGQSTGQVLSGVSTTAAVAVLPATSGDATARIVALATIAIGALVFASLTASRVYRNISK